MFGNVQWVVRDARIATDALGRRSDPWVFSPNRIRGDNGPLTFGGSRMWHCVLDTGFDHERLVSRRFRWLLARVFVGDETWDIFMAVRESGGEVRG